MNACGIALGSNLGDRLAHLRDACACLQHLHSGSVAPLISPVYETEPVDCPPGSGAYLNAVMEIEYDAGPVALLSWLQKIEAAMGRPSKHSRNAPRTIDLDLLYAGALTLHSGDLVLPHPRLLARRFVLAPLADIRPGLVLPGCSEPVLTLLRKLPPEAAVTRVFDEWAH